MTKLSEIKVNLSPNHNNVFKKRETIILRLAKDSPFEAACRS